MLLLYRQLWTFRYNQRQLEWFTATYFIIQFETNILMQFYFFSIRVEHNGSITKRSIFPYISNCILDMHLQWKQGTWTCTCTCTWVLIIVLEGRVVDIYLIYIIKQIHSVDVKWSQKYVNKTTTTSRRNRFSSGYGMSFCLLLCCSSISRFKWSSVTRARYLHIAGTSSRSWPSTAASPSTSYSIRSSALLPRTQAHFIQ